jgi:hypothetical protein
MHKSCDLDDELEKLFAVHANLRIDKRSTECNCVIRGTLSSASVKVSNITFSFDEFDVKIVIKNFPKNIPLCYEASSLNTDFHINPDKSLCLDTPFTLWEYFTHNPSLLGFVNKFLVAYFIQYK